MRKHAPDLFSNKRHKRMEHGKVGSQDMVERPVRCVGLSGVSAFKVCFAGFDDNVGKAVPEIVVEFFCGEVEPVLLKISGYLSYQRSELINIAL